MEKNDKSVYQIQVNGSSGGANSTPSWHPARLLHFGFPPELNATDPASFFSDGEVVGTYNLDKATEGLLWVSRVNPSREFAVASVNPYVKFAYRNSELNDILMIAKKGAIVWQDPSLTKIQIAEEVKPEKPKNKKVEALTVAKRALLKNLESLVAGETFDLTAKALAEINDALSSKD